KGRRPAASFTRADSNTTGKKLPEALSEAAQRGHEAPDRDPNAEYGPTALVVNQPRYGKTENHIEDDEGRAHQPAHLRIAQIQVAFDRLEDQRNDLAVEDVDHQRESENEYRIPGLGPAGPGFARRVSRNTLAMQRIGGNLSRFSAHLDSSGKVGKKRVRKRRK